MDFIRWVSNAPFLTMIVLALFATPDTRADWTLIPESRHQLYQSYSFFIEQSNAIFYRGQGEYWATVATNLPIVGNNDSPLHPQLIFHLSGNDSMHIDSTGGVFTETLDTRIGLMFESGLPWWDLRASVGFLHESGHAVDGISDLSLLPATLNLGDNVIRFRFLRDFDQKVRVGITIDAIIHAIPEDVASGIDEFIEYFPWGSNEDSRWLLRPYAAVGLIEGFSFNGINALNAQIGLSFGKHFEAQHGHTLRAVLGYYGGIDPRAKYAQFVGDTVSFGYTGLMFDL